MMEKPVGAMTASVPYSTIEDAYVVSRWDRGHRFCLRLVIADGSLLIQASNAYTRDQWLHSILWKKQLFKYRRVLASCTRPEVVLKELRSLVEMTVATPLQDECVLLAPSQIVSTLLDQEAAGAAPEDVISSVAPLLENYPPSAAMCRYFARHCRARPRSPVVGDALAPVVHRILKHNVDFGKAPEMRRFVQEYIRALHAHNGAEDVLRKFVCSIHGLGSCCPHPRVLPNLVSVCLAAIFSNFEERRIRLESGLSNNEDNPDEESEFSIFQDTVNKDLECSLQVLLDISDFDDWRPGLSQLLQPIPFPDEALADAAFVRCMVTVMKSISSDPRCDVHQMVLPVRESKQGWFNVLGPSGLVCQDEGELWGKMLETLLNCCCRRKRFIEQLLKQLGTCLLLALRGQPAAQQVLCLMLEWELLEQQDQRMQLVTTLQSTAGGRDRYYDLCRKQLHLKELQQKGGPRKLTLPSRSTDADIARLLSCGSFGNLECLSLAFTHVTSACAEQLIKLPSLRYLNLWATQFGDSGLVMISEHLPKLQVLNLCETPVSDKGITALSAMTNLRKLNLNSTKLSASTFERLKKDLPELQEFDVRYTEAW